MSLGLNSSMDVKELTEKSLNVDHVSWRLHVVGYQRLQIEKKPTAIGEFFNMTDEPVVIWDDFHDPSYDAFPMSQRQRTDQNALLRWTPWRESYAEGLRRSLPRMYGPMYGGFSSVESVKSKSLPYHGIRSAFMPVARFPAPFYHSACPAVDLVANPYSDISNNLRSANCPVENQHLIPVQKRDVFHIEQTQCCDVTSPRPSAPQCCFFGIGHLGNHRPRENKAPMDLERINTKTGSAQPDKVAMQVQKEKPATPLGVMLSPPQLIKTCVVQKELDHKKPNQNRLEAAGTKEGCQMNYGNTKHEELGKGASNSYPLQSAIGTFVKTVKKPSPKKMQNGQSFSNCRNNCARLTHSNQRALEVRPGTGSVVTTKYGFPRHQAKEGESIDDKSRAKCFPESSLLVTPREGSVVVHHRPSVESQGNENTPQDLKRNNSRFSGQHLSSMTSSSCHLGSEKSLNNESARKVERTFNLSISSKQYFDSASDITVPRQPTFLPNAGSLPRVQSYPLFNGNSQRGSSKSYYDLKASESVCMQLKPGASFNRAQLMQSEKTRVQGLKNKFADCYGVKMFSSPKRRCKRRNSKIGQETQHAACWSMENIVAVQNKLETSSIAMPNEEPLKVDQTRTMMASTFVNELEKRRETSSKGQGKLNDQFSFDKDNEKQDFTSRYISDTKIRKLCEQRRGKPIEDEHKMFETRAFEEHPVPFDGRCKQRLKSSPNNETTVPLCSQSQEVHHQVDDSSSKRKIASDGDTVLASPKARILVKVGESYRLGKTSLSQSTRSELKSLPPLPSEHDLESMGVDYGGFAIDHKTLPRIVAVHSIVAEKDGFREGNVVSGGERDVWTSLTRKPNIGGDYQESKAQMVPTESYSNLFKDKSRNDLDGTPSMKRSFLSWDTVDDRTILKEARNFALWNHISPPSNKITPEVIDPEEDVQGGKTENKQPSSRKKLTVLELSEKILYTRQRIEKEAIAWKRKLLLRVEGMFLKRLRKAEKETGEKADILIYEPSDEKVEKQRRRKLGKRRKTSTKNAKKQNTVAKE